MILGLDVSGNPDPLLAAAIAAAVIRLEEERAPDDTAHNLHGQLTSDCVEAEHVCEEREKRSVGIEAERDRLLEAGGAKWRRIGCGVRPTRNTSGLARRARLAHRALDEFPQRDDC